VHTEDNLLIDSIKSQGAVVGDFVYYQGLQGPIKIWGITYPAGIKLNPDYLNTTYPPELAKVTSGAY
jgi:hypothetical protein